METTKEFENFLGKKYNYELEKKIIENSDNIYNEVKEGYLDSAMLWCKENRSKLTKFNSKLEFKLVIQKYFQYILKSDVLNAINVLKDNLITPLDKESLGQLQLASR